MVLDLRPDVVLVDFRLPDMTGADVIRALSVSAPESRCVVLTGSGQDRALLESLDAGALGFVTKHQRFGEVVAALRAAARGEATISPALLGKVLPQLRSGADSGVRLTDRERSVLQLSRWASRINRSPTSCFCQSTRFAITSQMCWPNLTPEPELKRSRSRRATVWWRLAASSPSDLPSYLPSYSWSYSRSEFEALAVVFFFRGKTERRQGNLDANCGSLTR